MKHIRQLDGLRFVAIAFVLIEHYAIYLGQYISAGYYGVDLFFVLSGFLITGILLDYNGQFIYSYRTFIGRRTLRIFPIYYLTLIALLVLGNKDVRQYSLYCFTYTYNYAWVYFKIPLNSITHLWSLCVEEQFYIFWPFLILGLRRKLSALKIVLLILIIICSIQLVYGLVAAVAPYNSVGLIPRANSLAIGGLGAIVMRENGGAFSFFKKKWMEFLALGILVFLLTTEYKVKYVLCPVISLFFISKAATDGFALGFLDKFLKNRRICYIGSISYGIYLYHLPLGYYFANHFFNPFVWGKINWEKLGKFRKLQWHPWIIALPIFSGLAILFAHFSYLVIEKPILSLKEKWFKLPSKA